MRERDPSENAETAPPHDEYVDLRCMWAVEFYTPAEMDRLIQHAANLDKAARFSPPHLPTVSSWLNHTIGHPFASSWMDLGTWQPKGRTPRVIPLDREIDLPDSVDYATGRISVISPSIISVVVCFVFDDDFAPSFDGVLRVDKKTYAVPHGNGASFFEPETQKQSDIEMIRTQMSQRAAAWFKEAMPGVFSDGLLGGQLPTCEFLTLRKAEPFPESEQFSYPNVRYTAILAVDRNREAWAYTRIPGIKFAVDSRSRSGPRFHSMVAINEQSWPDADMQMYGTEPRWARANFMSQMMPDVLSYWALWPLLVGYTEEINRIRNSGAGKFGNGINVAKALERVWKRMASLSDMAAVSADLAEFSVSPRISSHLAGQFKPCQPQLYSGSNTLLEMFVKSITERAKWLRITDQSVMDHLSQLGTMFAAAENVRIQRAITWLTVAILLLTVFSAALFATQVSIPVWIKSILDQARTIFNR